MSAKIFYGTTNGNTERVAELIQQEFGGVIEESVNIADADPSDLSNCDKLILGSSTWEDGQLQEDWQDFFPSLDEVDFTGKTVAIFGLGDAYGYSGEFVNAIRKIYDKVKERGATVVGEWSTEGYDFEHSSAVEDGKFIGLAIDEDNESDLTEERVKNWVAQIKPSFS